MLPGIVDLKFHVGLEVGEGGVDGVGDHDEIHGDVGRLFEAEGDGEIGQRQFFVGHPGGDLADSVVVGAHVAGVLDDRTQTLGDGTAQRSRPGNGFVGGGEGWSFGGGECGYGAESLQKLTAVDGHRCPWGGVESREASYGEGCGQVKRMR